MSSAAGTRRLKISNSLIQASQNAIKKVSRLILKGQKGHQKDLQEYCSIIFEERKLPQEEGCFLDDKYSLVLVPFAQTHSKKQVLYTLFQSLFEASKFSSTFSIWKFK